MKEELIKEMERNLSLVMDYDEYSEDCGYGDQNYIEFEYNKMAKELIDMGWAKQVWHKVAEGDLPEYAGSYLVVCGDESLPEYDVDFYENYKGGKRWIHNEGRVIAWTDRPEYK